MRRVQETIHRQETIRLALIIVGALSLFVLAYRAGGRAATRAWVDEEVKSECMSNDQAIEWLGNQGGMNHVDD